MTEFHPDSIIVPTDLSSASVEAVCVARQITASDEAVTVVFVALDHDLITPAHLWGMDEIAQDNAEAHRRRLRTWVNDNNLGSVRQEIRCGDPGMEICTLASDFACPLIVIPSHNRKGIPRILLGSVAERVLRHAKCSVLVIRRGEREKKQTACWLPRKRVIVPVDLSESTSAAIETAMTLVDSPQDIHIVHVVHTVSDSVFTGSITICDDELKQNRKKCLQRYLEEHGWGSLKTHVVFGDPGMTVAEYADNVGAGLVVIPSHGFHGLNRLLLGSTTERVLRHTNTPVLVLRRQEAGSDES